jgi:cytoskeletal protein CcmA (bactofilin family)
MRFLIVLLIAMALATLVLLPTILEILRPKDNKPLFINQNYFANLKYFLNKAEKEKKLLNNNVSVNDGDEDIATTGNILIPASTKMTGWAHCNELHMKEESILDGKATANKVALEHGSKFKRISAPEITMGFNKDEQRYIEWDNRELRNKVVIHKKTDIDGDALVIKNNMECNTVAKGDILVKKDVVINGSIKANGNITIENGVTIMGSIFAEGNIKIGNNCLVYGHIVAEKQLTIGYRFQGGYSGPTNSKPITILGETINMHSSIINGTILAKKYATYI